MALSSTISGLWNRFQGELFPALAEEVGPLLENHRTLVRILDLVEVERFVTTHWGVPGRPLEDRRALLRAFIAKAVWDAYVAVAFMLRWLRRVRVNRDIAGISATFHFGRRPYPTTGFSAATGAADRELRLPALSLRPARGRARAGISKVPELPWIAPRSRLLPRV